MKQGQPLSIRDERYDLFRGVALIGIALNHIIPPQQLMNHHGHYQLQTGLFFNFADIFVFISGCVGGIAYWKFLSRGGIIKAHQKCAKRMLEIFAFNLVACVLCIWMVTLLQGPVREVFGFEGASQGMLSIVMGTVLMYDPMPFFDILGLYMIFLVFLPGFICLHRRWRFASLGVSLVIYLLSQGWFYVGEGQAGSMPFFGHPAAWQFLFYVGVTIGVELASGNLKIKKNTMVILAIGLYFLTGSFLEQMQFAYFHFTDKAHLGLLRVTDLLAVSYLIAVFIPRHMSDRLGLVRPVIQLGRNGLFVFVLGLVVSYLVSLVLAYLDSGRLLYMSLVLAVTVFFYGVGQLFVMAPRFEPGLNLKLGAKQPELQ